MGGIKNKLNNKLSNKTLFKVPLWLQGDVRRKSDRGIVSDTNPLGSRLPSFSQPSEMLTRNISNTRKPNRWSLYASKTIGSLHLVTLTKYLSITCLALALISTISLNIIRTYFINNTRTNALEDSSLGSSSATTSQGSAATLANDPNPISISLSNATGSPDPTSGNISITTPTGGGIATGSHTVTIHTSSLVSGYNVTLHSSGGDTDLAPSDFGKGNNNLIEPAGGSTNPAHLDNPTTLANNQWGVALPGSTLYPNKYSNTNDYTSTNQTTLANTKYAAIPGKG